MCIDICSNGEDARRHVGNDIKQSRKSIDRAQNKISYFSGAIVLLVPMTSCNCYC